MNKTIKRLSTVGTEELKGLNGCKVRFTEDVEYSLLEDLDEAFRREIKDITEVQGVGTLNETVVIPKGTEGIIIVKDGISKNTNRGCLYVDFVIKGVSLPEILTEYMEGVFVEEVSNV